MNDLNVAPSLLRSLAELHPTPPSRHALIHPHQTRTHTRRRGRGRHFLRRGFSHCPDFSIWSTHPTPPPPPPNKTTCLRFFPGPPYGRSLCQLALCHTDSLSYPRSGLTPDPFVLWRIIKRHQEQPPIRAAIVWREGRRAGALCFRRCNMRVKLRMYVRSGCG